MTNAQVTLVQIDNYGPWTVTPEPRRESDLQALQAELYADLSTVVGSHGGCVFFARFDNMVAVTNGIDRSVAERIQATVRTRYPVTVSLSTATGGTPRDALCAATENLQAAGGAQDADRREALCWQGGTDDEVWMAHFDVVDATGRYTDSEDAFRSLLRVRRTELALAERLHERGALAFFVGGDNFVAVCPTIDREGYEATVEYVREAVGVDLRVGVGRGDSAAAAGMAAKHALEECREQGRTVGGDLPAAPEK